MSRKGFLCLLTGSFLVLAGTGCERLFDKGRRDNLQAADKKVSAGDWTEALRLYEAALDGSPESGETHYRMALIYADKLKQPVDALHHFRRYVQLQPKGGHVKEALDYEEEGNRQLLAALTGGTPFTQADAVRLKNENQTLRTTLAALRAQKSATPVPGAPGDKRGEGGQKPIAPGVRTHTVQSGETLGTIAQKYYKNRDRYREIEEANFYPQKGTPRLRAGMVLAIP